MQILKRRLTLKQLLILVPVTFLLLALLSYFSLQLAFRLIPVSVPFRGFASNLWDLDSINECFELPIPDDASAVEYDGHMGRGGYLDISFEASSESVMAYAAMFCEGVLHQGYDPFNGIDVSQPRSGAYPISSVMNDYAGVPTTYVYYSYSTDTPDTILGIRCSTVLSPNFGQFQVVIDKANPEKYKFRLEWRYDCPKCSILYP